MSNRQEGNEAIVRNDEEAVQPKRRALTRQDFLKITAGVAGVGVGAVGLTINTQPANAQKATKLDPLTLSCVEDTDHTIFLKVKAGATGAPAGFSLHWVKHSDYPALTCGASGESQKSLWPSTGDCDATTTPNNCNVCSASFSGVPGCSNHTRSRQFEGWSVRSFTAQLRRRRARVRDRVHFPCLRAQRAGRSE